MSDAELTCVIEIPKGSRNKYEYDPALGAIKLDRFVSASVVYPTDYGFVPDTMAPDGDPLDVLVCVSEPTFPGCIVLARAVGLFRMADEKGDDDHVLCVPIDDPGWNTIERIDEVPAQLRNEISHFFAVYKDLDPGRHSEVRGWADRDAALEAIEQSRQAWRAGAGVAGAPPRMFHVELRQFPHVARAFNMDRERLELEILGPWAAGVAVELQDRSWEPGRAKLAIVEGPSLAPEELGLGRGWTSAVRAGEDVTQALLAEARAGSVSASVLPAVKATLLERLGAGPLELDGVVALASRERTGARASELLALAELAVWELLHEGVIGLARGGREIGREDWQATLLDWESWAGEAAKALQLRLCGHISA